MPDGLKTRRPERRLRSGLLSVSVLQPAGALLRLLRLHILEAQVAASQVFIDAS